MLLRPAYLAEVGLFDERFFLYYEDTDLSARGTARGWRYRFVPTSVVRHRHAASSGVASPLLRWHVERNRLLYLTKNAPWGQAAAAVARHPLSTLSYARRDVVGPWLDHRPVDASTVRLRLSAYVGYLRLAPAMLAERRRRAANVGPSVARLRPSAPQPAARGHPGRRRRAGRHRRGRLRLPGDLGPAAGSGRVRRAVGAVGPGLPDRRRVLPAAGAGGQPPAGGPAGGRAGGRPRHPPGPAAGLRAGRRA